MRIMEYGQHVINIVLLILTLFSVFSFGFVVSVSDESKYVLGIIVLGFFVLALLYITITNSILLILSKIRNFLLTSSENEIIHVHIPKRVENMINKLFMLISIAMTTVVALVILDYFIPDVSQINILGKCVPTKWGLVLGKPLLAIAFAYWLWGRLMQPMYKLVDSYNNFLRNVMIRVYPPFVEISSDPKKSDSIEIIVHDISQETEKIKGNIFVRFPKNVGFYVGSIFNKLNRKQIFEKDIEISKEHPFEEVTLIPVYLGNIRSKDKIIVVRVEFENGLVREYTIGAKLVPE